MLLYRAWDAQQAPTVAVPAAARHLVESANAAVRERRQAEAERLNRVTCTVRWDGKKGDDAGERGASEACRQHDASGVQSGRR